MKKPANIQVQEKWLASPDELRKVYTISINKHDYGYDKIVTYYMTEKGWKELQTWEEKIVDNEKEATRIWKEKRKDRLEYYKREIERCTQYIQELTRG